MGHTCAVSNCLSASYANKDLRFHQFPHGEERCKLWAKACWRPDLLEKKCESLRHTYICSLHFERKMYARKSLKKTAVPTLLLPKETVHIQMDPEEKIDSSEEETVDSEGPTSDEIKAELPCEPESLEYIQPSTSSRFIEEPRKKMKRGPDTSALGDEYDAIGINVAAKLRNLPDNMRILAEKLIGDVLFQAQTNGLTSASALVTPDPFR